MLNAVINLSSGIRQELPRVESNTNCSLSEHTAVHSRSSQFQQHQQNISLYYKQFFICIMYSVLRPVSLKLGK